MRTMTSGLFGAALLAVAASCGAADWNQVFKQTTVEASATQPAAAPAAAAPARAGAAARARMQVPARTQAQSQAVVVAPTEAVARGEALYRKGDIPNAAREFELHAQAAGTPAEQSSTLFRIGVQWQGEVSNAPAAQRVDVRNAAISAYRKSIDINPKSGPALNNLAQIYKSEPGTRDEADALLARAVALDDSRKGVYLMNRAALKRDSNDLKAATEFAEQAAADDKGNLAAHELVMSILAKRQDSSALLDYIRDLDSRGLVLRALESAADGFTRFPDARKQLLTSMANSIGNAAYTDDPWKFEKSEAGQSVQKFLNDPAVGQGVSELFRILHTPAPVNTLTWWRNGFDGFSEPFEGSPAEALQNLTLRCGEIYQVIGDARAEDYYRMSVTLSGKISTDPRALLGLTEILFEQKRLDDLNKVLAENEPGLMEAKRRTIAASDFLHTYQLRVALGMMYGYGERWVSTGPQYYANSIWMLEHAQQSAQVYNSQRNIRPEQKIKLPPNAVKMLSTGYAQTKQIERSVEIRLKYAEIYLKDEQPRFAKQVLDPKWQGSLPDAVGAELRKRLADLSARAEAAS